jgi:PhnB protein
MSIKSLNPYLTFDGTAEQAIKLYERALGAQVDGGIMRFGDAPPGAGAPGAEQRIMHAQLRLGKGTVMLSDSPPGRPPAKESNTHITLDFDDASDMSARFDALAAGGTVTMPHQDTFWGARFGMLTDAFGIRWMFNCELKKG